MRRIIFYLFYDPQGQVDDYVTHMLTKLRDSADFIYVVSNSVLSTEGRSRLETVADEVFARENVGFDVWAHKEAMERFGADRLAEYDELVLMNHTFFGPVYPFGETFDRMDQSECDFWGISAHKEIAGPPGEKPALAFHLQSHWIAVRKVMFASAEFRDYWATMPMIRSYEESIGHHEARFTQHFAAKGFAFEVAFPPDKYPSNSPVFESLPMMLDDRFPMIKRRIFFHEPLYLERNAILGKRVMEHVATTEYPSDLIWSNIARSAEPRSVYTNSSLLEVISDEPRDVERPAPPPRIVVIAHIYYDDMVDEVMSYVSNIPVPYDLIVTTSDADKAERIGKALGGYDTGRVEVRVVEQNRGRDMSALFITCRDVLLSDDYDLICRVHSKKSPQDAFNSSNLFKHHLFDNLLGSRPYVERVLELFADNATLGMVFPPIVNIGYPTLGHAWFLNRAPAEKLAEKLGVTVPFDRTTPLSSYGSMFWARPEAIRRMARQEFRWTEYPDEGKYSDGSLPHVQERILSYCALTDGYHVRCVINHDWAAINYTFLEYKLALISSFLPHQAEEQMQVLLRAQASRSTLQALKESVDRRFPHVGKAARPAYRAARWGYRKVRHQE